MHRDIKPQNILVKNKKILKIADFGLAKYVGDDITYTYVGTTFYMAPEIINKKGLFLFIFLKLSFFFNFF